VASGQVPDIPVRRHSPTDERPFQAVLDGIYDGASQTSARCSPGSVSSSKNLHYLKPPYGIEP
jgi:hypothetical protein